jgi:hypothetical protein
MMKIASEERPSTPISKKARALALALALSLSLSKHLHRPQESP